MEFKKNSKDEAVSIKREKIWQTEISLLVQLDSVCKKYGLRYYVTNGTLLGTVRHKGFIPWDDDLDVMMPRPDYEKLIALAEKEFKEPYYLHISDADGNYYRNYIRLRDENTTAIPVKDFYHNCSKGIFVDIFPIDGCPDSKIKQKIQSVKIAVLCEMANSYVYLNDFKKHKFVRKVLAMMADKVSKKQGYDSFLRKIEDERQIYPYGKQKNVQVILHGDFPNVFPTEFFESTAIGKFENLEVPMPCEFDKILKIIYGDYMQLPPEEKRYNHHSIFFDPDEAYSVKSEMTFEEMIENMYDY